EGFGEGRNPEVYKDNPIVAYPIIGHVDVQREYNPRTGEQTNVIVENTTDRPWHQRSWIRVNWSSPQVANWFFLSTPDANFQNNTISTYVPENEGGADAFTFGERDEEGRTDYFDFTERMFVRPSLQGCILELN